MDILNAILGLFSGDLVTMCLKLGLGIGVAVGFFFLMRWIKKKQDEAAHNQSDQGRTDDQGKIDDQNHQIFDDAHKSENDINNEIDQKTGGKS